MWLGEVDVRTAGAGEVRQMSHIAGAGEGELRQMYRSRDA